MKVIDNVYTLCKINERQHVISVTYNTYNITRRGFFY